MQNIKEQAKKRANDAYPSALVWREVYIDGYEQAARDLALTWEDILSIVKISEQHKRDEWCDKQTFCEAVLQEFNKQKYNEKETNF